jgi:hypothetical protein
VKQPLGSALAIGVLILGIAALAVVSSLPAEAPAGTTTSAGSPLPSATTASPSESPDQTPGVATPSPVDVASLVAALADGDITMVPVDATDEARITSEQALLVARETYTLGKPTASLARLTVDGYHVGDTTTPLSIEDRLVYVVQLTGLDMAPFGGDASTETIHHELVVFVDAVTGDMLMATTVR